MQRPIPVTVNIMLRPLYHTMLVVEFDTLHTVCLESDLKRYIFALAESIVRHIKLGAPYHNSI
jgi:hypothetical protein